MPDWELDGNSIGANDFLGTTNDQPLVIRTNNVERMRIDSGGITLGSGNVRLLA